MSIDWKYYNNNSLPTEWCNETSHIRRKHEYFAKFGQCTPNPCMKCRLMSAREHKWLQRGPYREQYELEELPVNRKFVRNPYRPKSCKNSDVVCHSLTNGMLPQCTPIANLPKGKPVYKPLHYTATGKLVEY